MKIWHDNSGMGQNASWFLKHILIRDLQTDKKFYFLCQKWFALEIDDGKIECDLFVANETEKEIIKYLIKKESNHQIRHNHLWFPVFYSPTRSLFTRLDRFTCCFVFHYMSMLLNILYYEKNLLLFNSNNQNIINFSIININLQQVKDKLIIHRNI